MGLLATKRAIALLLIVTASLAIFALNMNDASASSGSWSSYDTGYASWDSGQWKYKQKLFYRHNADDDIEVQKVMTTVNNYYAEATEEGAACGKFELWFGDISGGPVYITYQEDWGAWEIKSLTFTPGGSPNHYDKGPYGALLSLTKAQWDFAIPSALSNSWEIQADEYSTTITEWTDGS